MKTLFFAAAFSLILHGLLFSFKADWLPGEAVMPFEQKNLSITMAYHTLPRPSIESMDFPSLEIPVRAEKLHPEKDQLQKEKQSALPPKETPPVPVTKKTVRPPMKPAPSKELSLPPKPEPLPGTSSAVTAGPNPLKAVDEKLREGRAPGSQDVLEGHKGPGLNKPPPVIYPQAYEDNPLPEYPRMAKHRGYEGVVTLEVRVSPEGKVLEVRILQTSGYSVLDEAAKQAVETYRFRPGKKGGQNIEMWGNVPIRIELD